MLGCGCRVNTTIRNGSVPTHPPLAEARDVPARSGYTVLWPGSGFDVRIGTALPRASINAAICLWSGSRRRSAELRSTFGFLDLVTNWGSISSHARHGLQSATPGSGCH